MNYTGNSQISQTINNSSTFMILNNFWKFRFKLCNIFDGQWLKGCQYNQILMLHNIKINSKKIKVVPFFSKPNIHFHTIILLPSNRLHREIDNWQWWLFTKESSDRNSQQLLCVWWRLYLLHAYIKTKLYQNNKPT